MTRPPDPAEQAMAPREVPEEAPPARRRGVSGTARVIVYASLFLAMAGYGITVPVMPFLARDFGASPLGVSTLVSLFALAQFLSSPWWGTLSDRFGRRKLLVFGLAGYALSFVLAGLADSLAGLVAARTLGGFLSASIFPSSQALIADVTTSEERGPAMAAMGAWVNLGFLFGPVIGGVLSPLGYHLPLFIAGGLTALTAVFALTGLKETAPGVNGGVAGAEEKLGTTAGAARAEEAAGAPGNDGPQPGRRGIASLADIRAALTSRISPYLLLTFATASSLSTQTALLAYFVVDRLGGSSAQAATMFTAQGLMGFVVQSLLVGRLINRFGERNIAIAGTAFGVFGFGLMAGAGSLAAAVTAVMVLSLGASLVRPSLTSAASLLTPLPQGLTMGVQSSLDSLGRVAGPTFGGWIYDFGVSLPFIGSAIVLAGFGGLLIAGTRTRGRSCATG